MTRNPLETAVAGARCWLLAFVVAACGSDDNNSSSTSSAARPSATLEGEEGRHAQVLGASDVDFLDPGKTYYTVRLPCMPTPPTARSTPSSPSDVDTGAGPRRRHPPRSPTDQKTVTVKIKQGVKFGPPVNRAVTSADVKYAFERFFSATSAVSTRATSARSRARPSKATTAPRTSPASTTPDDQTIVFKLRTAPACSSRRPWSCRSRCRCRRSTRRSTTPRTRRRTTRTSSRPARTWSRTTPGQDHRLQAGQEHRRSCATRTGTPRPTTGRPTLDEITSRRRNDSDASSRRGRCSTARHGARHEPAGGRSQAGRHQVQGPVPVRSRRGGCRYFPLNTTIKPLDNSTSARRSSPASTATRPARRAAASSSATSRRTTSRRTFPGFEEAGGMKGSGHRLSSEPRAAT